MRTARRPTFLNLARLRFPVGAVASIGHRISGVMLVVMLPFPVLALERSLTGEAVFASLLEGFQSPAGRVALVAAAWASAHHLFAGIRHLLMDVGIGASLATARASAFATIIGAAVLAVLVLLA